MSAGRVSPTERKKIAHLYRDEGKGIAEVGRVVDRHPDTVRRALERENVELRDNRSVNVDPAAVARAYEVDHLSLRAIAAQFGIGYGTAHRLVSEHCQVRPRRARASA